MEVNELPVWRYRKWRSHEASCSPVVHDSTSVVSFSSETKGKAKARSAFVTADRFIQQTVSSSLRWSQPRLTIEGVDVQQHGALPLVGGPLQLSGGVDSGSGSRELQRCQQFVLAQRAVLPWTVVRHVPARGAMYRGLFRKTQTLLWEYVQKPSLVHPHLSYRHLAVQTRAHRGNPDLFQAYA